MLVLTAVIVLLGVGLMFYITVQQVDDRVDDVQRTVTSNFDKLRTDVERQIQQAQQQQSGGTLPVPTVTPVPTEAPTVDPNVTPEATEDPLATPDETATPDASATATPEEPEIINP